MSTQKYIQVEAIVAKYENLASETEAVKKTQSAFTDFFILKSATIIQYTIKGRFMSR